jgi:hypothetical protein
LKKGTAIIEVIIAIVILSLASIPLFITLISERSVSDYSLNHITVVSLAQAKMNDIEGKLRSNMAYYAVNTYYGFQYDPGSTEDINHDPANTAYQADPGTFFRDGLPEYRYQFYITNDGNGKFIHLRVWRRPVLQGGLIVSTFLYEEVFSNAF